MSAKSLSKEAWDQVAGGYRSYWSPRFAPYLRRAVEAFRPAPEGPLVVAGCGPGDEVLELGARFPDRSVMAVDLSPAMTAVAAGRAREAGLSNVLVAVDDATEVSARLRQAGGLLSCFTLQLLPDPLEALADWSRALRPGGGIAALFWPRIRDGSPFARLSMVLEEMGADRRGEWEEAALLALPRLGLDLAADERPAFEMSHASPEEVWRQLRESGPLQTIARRMGKDLLARTEAEWLADHGLEERGGAWVHRPTARLWLLTRSGEGPGPEAH